MNTLNYLDPIDERCRVTSSFTPVNTTPITSGHPLSLPAVIKPLNDGKNELYIDQFILDRLNELRSLMKRDDYLTAEKLVCPLLRVGRSIFIDQQALILTSIDLTFAISGYIPSLLAYQSLGRYTFVSINEQSGSWTQYLQFRRPQSFAYLVSSSSVQLKYLDETRISQVKGNSQQVIDEIKSFEPEGVDLVIGHGNSQEMYINQVYVALSTLKTTGSFIMPITGTEQPVIASLLYILALAFDYLWLYKPALSSNCSDVRYIIAKGFRGRQGDYKTLITEVSNWQSVPRILALPEEFKQWITDSNNILTRMQIEHLEKVEKLLNDQEVEVPEYNLYRCLIILDVPDTTDEPVQPDYRGSKNYIDDVTLSTNPSLR